MRSCHCASLASNDQQRLRVCLAGLRFVCREFLARPFDEALLFEIASAYEAGTKHRRPPSGFGPLKDEP